MEKICAGIVLYNPEMERLKNSIRNVQEQIEEIILIDNGSDNIAEIRKLHFPNVVLIENGDNLGIATALNYICREASQRGYNWVLTLDQDTIVPDNLIREMDKYISNNDIAIICPAVYYEGWKSEPILKDTTEYVKACMTSASLTRLASWKEVGGFREDFFIDFVDNDYCQKLRINGYKILRINSCVITHSLGEVREIRVLGGIINRRFPIHRPWRYYYMIRNNIVFIREYKQYINVRKEWVKVGYIAITGWIHTNKKKETLRYILKGKRDAKAGKMGKMTDC